MSIALSAIVGPSRMARRILAAWTLAQWCAAAMVLAAPARFAMPGCLAAILGGAGAALACAAARPPKTHRIDISGTGELRVTVQQNVRAARHSSTAATVATVAVAPDRAVIEPAATPSTPSTLSPGSVIWPGLIVLRLGAADGRSSVVPIWRDGVDGDTWRALTVALGVVGKADRPGGG